MWRPLKVRLVAVAPGQVFANARDELVVAERLAEKVVGSPLEAAQPIDDVVAAAENDHRHVAVRSELAQQGEPIARTENPVQEDQVRATHGQELPSRRQVERRLYLEPFAGENIGKKVGQIAIVFDDEDLHHIAPHGAIIIAGPA